VRRMVSWLAALALPTILLSGSFAADKKADKEEKPGDGWVKSGTMVGKIMTVYEDKRKLRLQINYQIAKLNPSALAGIQQAQMQMARATTVAARIQAQQQMMQQQRNLYTYEKKSKELEFQAIEDVVVRTAKPREAFDEKGKIKKFTKAELKELKGDPKLPGYKAEFGDLTADQIVKLTIVRKKGEPAPKARPKKKGKDDDGLDAELIDDTPHVGMILILADPPPAK
jgi:hypothetical protein